MDDIPTYIFRKARVRTQDYDTATGHPIVEGMYFQHLGPSFVFDRLTVSLWLGSFPQTCPLTGEYVPKITLVPLSPIPVSYNASPLFSPHGTYFSSYKIFCTTTAEQYSQQKNYLLISEKAKENIPSTLQLLCIVLLLYALHIIPLVLFTIMLTSLLITCIHFFLVWLSPYYFAQTQDTMDIDIHSGKHSWIHPLAETLVTYWQLHRFTAVQQGQPLVDLGSYNTPCARVGLETMRRLVADAYLSLFKGRYLGPLYTQGIDAKYYYLKHLPLNFHENLQHLYRMRLPPIRIIQAKPLSATEIPQAVAVYNPISQPTEAVAVPVLLHRSM